MKRLRNLLLSVTITCSFCIPAALLQAAQPGTMTYTTMDSIGLRVEPKPTARVIATLAPHVRVRVNFCDHGWCNVTAKGITGYVLEDFLALSAPPAEKGPGHKNPQSQ